MIYKTLRTLPMVICVEIMQTGNYSLLADEQTDIDLVELWNDLESKLPTEKDSKVFDVSKEMEFQANRYNIIQYCCEALTFDKDFRLINLLQEYGYILRDDNYFNDIDKISKQSEGILIKISQLKASLPKTEKSNEESTIIDVMASFCAILGITFDFITCSVESFYAWQRQVENKIKALESTNKK